MLESNIQLLEMGFKQTPSDPCIYTSLSDGLCVLAVYVNDILITGKCCSSKSRFGQEISSEGFG